MHIVHIALGGCLSFGPVTYSITADTGGHIAYLLGATEALSAHKAVHRRDIVSRAFSGPADKTRFSAPVERLDAKRTMLRLSGLTDRYLEKEALGAELPLLTQAFLVHFSWSDTPDVIHAHFEDAAALAIAAKEAFGIPFLFSSHSLGLQKPANRECARIARERLAIKRPMRSSVPRATKPSGRSPPTALPPPGAWSGCRQA